MKVIVQDIKREYEGFLKLDICRLQFERFDGSMSNEVVRENFYRSDSVAVLIYDPQRRTVLLTKQFRYSVYTKDPEQAWFLEIVAGSGEPDEEPGKTIVREIKEEANLEVRQKDLEFITRFYVSPGGTSERISLYAIPVPLENEGATYAGKKDEHEDIKIIPVSYENAFCMISSGEICDAKTIMALQWLQLQENK